MVIFVPLRRCSVTKEEILCLMNVFVIERCIMVLLIIRGKASFAVFSANFALNTCYGKYQIGLKYHHFLR